jgi:hypothetical protein
MVTVDCRIKEYAKYILVYIKVKIVEISKYDLSCTRHGIIIAIRQVIIIFWTIK